MKPIKFIKALPNYIFIRKSQLKGQHLVRPVLMPTSFQQVKYSPCAIIEEWVLMKIDEKTTGGVFVEERTEVV